MAANDAPIRVFRSPLAGESDQFGNRWRHWQLQNGSHLGRGKNQHHPGAEPPLPFARDLGRCEARVCHTVPGSSLP